MLSYLIESHLLHCITFQKYPENIVMYIFYVLSSTNNISVWRSLGRWKRLHLLSERRSSLSYLSIMKSVQMSDSGLKLERCSGQWNIDLSSKQKKDFSINFRTVPRDWVVCSASHWNWWKFRQEHLIILKKYGGRTLG